MYTAGQLQEVSSMISHVPTHPAVISLTYGTGEHRRFMYMPAHKHMQSGGKQSPLGIKYRHSTENLVL